MRRGSRLCVPSILRFSQDFLGYQDLQSQVIWKLVRQLVYNVVYSKYHVLRTGLHLLKKSLMENFIFCAVVAKLLSTSFIHSALKSFEKLTLKKKRNFKRSYLDEFRVETRIFRKFIQFSSKQRYFLRTLSTWVHDRRICPLQPLPILLPSQQLTQLKELMMSPEKVLNLALFSVFLSIMS